MLLLYVLAILSWVVKPEFVDSDPLLGTNAIKLPRDMPNKATDENVNIERVRKYFTKEGWKKLKSVLLEKKENLSWSCTICQKDLHAVESIACDYCLQWYHWKCVHLKFAPKTSYWGCRICFT